MSNVIVQTISPQQPQVITGKALLFHYFAESTEDTGSEITLYPTGNFCNSANPNTNTEFDVVFTNPDNSQGENATVLILSNTAFPTVNGALLVEGAPFEDGMYYDLYTWSNGNTIRYTFFKIGATYE